jgi:hypothetical protein
MMLVAGPVMALMGRVGDGVFGPLEEAAEVNDDDDPVFDKVEPCLGDEYPEEYAWPGRRGGRDGSLLSLLIKSAASSGVRRG